MTAQNRNRIWIWIGSIAGGLILILAFGAMFISARWKPILTEKIKEGVYNGSSHLYNIDFDEVGDHTAALCVAREVEWNDGIWGRRGDSQRTPWRGGDTARRPPARPRVQPRISPCPNTTYFNEVSPSIPTGPRA